MGVGNRLELLIRNSAMNDQDRLELEQLRRRQELLQQQLALLNRHIEEFGRKLSSESPGPTRPAPTLQDVPIKIRPEPAPVPPIIATTPTPAPLPTVAQTSAPLSQ